MRCRCALDQYLASRVRRQTGARTPTKTTVARSQGTSWQASHTTCNVLMISYPLIEHDATLNATRALLGLELVACVSTCVQYDHHMNPTHAAPTRKGTLHTAHSTQHTAHCTLHTAHCTLHTAHCTLHTAHCTLHTAHCTLHTALTTCIHYLNDTHPLHRMTRRCNSMLSHGRAVRGHGAAWPGAGEGERRRRRVGGRAREEPQPPPTRKASCRASATWWTTG